MGWQSTTCGPRVGLNGRLGDGLSGRPSCGLGVEPNGRSEWQVSRLMTLGRSLEEREDIRIADVVAQLVYSSNEFCVPMMAHFFYCPLRRPLRCLCPSGYVCSVSAPGIFVIIVILAHSICTDGTPVIIVIIVILAHYVSLPFQHAIDLNHHHYHFSFCLHC